jgi:hypothetical protein
MMESLRSPVDGLTGPLLSLPGGTAVPEEALTWGEELALWDSEQLTWGA